MWLWRAVAHVRTVEFDSSRSYGDWTSFESTGSKLRSLRTRDLVWVLSPFKRLLMSRRRVRSASHRLDRYYSEIAEAFSADVLVDATKNPAIGYLVGDLDSVDLYCLHLVRDPLRVADSWASAKADPGGISKGLVRRTPLYSTIAWVIWNVVIEMLWRPSDHRYLRVRHEDFTGNPEEVLQRIANFIGVESSCMPILESRRIELTASHTAAGNPDRFSTGTIVIRSDATPTKVRLSPIQRRLVRTLAWPLNRRYGYR